jgi:predicted secreted protein
MGWFENIVVYVVIWWMVLFTVLPWGNRAPEQAEPGHATSAPSRPRLLIKFAITTAVATALFFVARAVILSDLITFRES